MMDLPVLLVALALASLYPSDALQSLSIQQSVRTVPTLSYTIGGDDADPQFAPLRPLRLRIGSDFQLWQQQRVAAASQTQQPTIEKSATAKMIRPSMRVPRRAMPHVRNTSHAEDATRAGYIIRQGDLAANDPSEDLKYVQQIGQVRGMRRLRLRPLRSIPRIGQRGQQEIRIETIDSTTSADIHNRSNFSDARSKPSMLAYRPQIDELLDTAEQTLRDRDGRRRGARRVTFKATREATKALISKPMATLTEYMTQPVSQYSLLSFHDLEGSSGYENPKQRRWHVRRLSKGEAQRYTSSEDSETMDASNLFRLAVPLLPLIGWDLTPVIDLEVVQMMSCKSAGAKVNEDLSKMEESYVTYETLDADASTKWAPLRGIRRRMSRIGHDTKSDVGNSPLSSPVVKIRSLSVSLLSTQKEVNEIMSNRKNGSGKINQRNGSNMQREAIEMVSKVEDWLRPHITFEAELSWTDGVSNSSGVENNDSLSSTVTVKSTAITFLTIPEIQSDIIRKSVPSGFLVKRLGAALTSRALAICLPRFLNQLEKDYNRWS